MPKIQYRDINFRDATLVLIATANRIIAEYEQQGFSLTLRQLYYQLVARDILPNRQNEYKRLGSIVTDARMTGLIDWYAIEDRTRALRGNSHWDSPRAIVRSAIAGYQIDKWSNQEHRVEVWIEKDALIGVISGVCKELDIDYFSCRGYPSASEVWKGGRRLGEYVDCHQEPLIIHMADHDPSGMDMTRDLAERLGTFAECYVDVKRVALNMEQVDEYEPPPNPAKLSDSRAGRYIQMHGYDSWELDALEPAVLAEIIREETLAVRDEMRWAEMIEREEIGRNALRAAYDNLQ